MAKIIETRAVLAGEDKLSPLLDRVAKKLKQIEAAEKTSARVDKTAASLRKIASQVAAMEKFDASKIGFANARKNLHDTEMAVDRAALAMKNAEGPANRLVSEYRRAQQAAAAASRAMENQRFAVLGAKNALDSVGGSLGNAALAQHRLAAAVDRTNAAMQRQAKWAARRRELGILGNYAGMAVGYGMMSGARATLHTYREFDKERRFQKAVMGITDNQQAPLVSQAIHMGATTKYNDIQVLKAQRMSAARGMNVGQVMGLVQPAANFGQSLDMELPEATQQMEAAIFGYRRDISTPAATLASATRTADMQVKAAKVSGMDVKDLEALYRFGAPSGKMAGMSEENLLTFGGILKKANIGGSEAGVAYRAMMGSLNAPTRKAKEAMLANGMNFKHYQKNPDHLALKPFLQNVAAQYGVRVTNKTAWGLDKIFRNKALIADPAKFTPAVMKFLKHSLGGSNAKSLRSIAGAANRYRDASMKGVHTDKFVEDLMKHLAGNLQFANALFGPKQGSRIANALRSPEYFHKMKEEIENQSKGYSGKIATERMGGFDGAVSRLEGSGFNAKTAIGRSFDNGGAGGPLTAVTNEAARLVQSFAELSPKVIEVTSTFALIAGATAGLKGIVNLSSLLFGDGGLKGSATALDGSAAALTRAAIALGGGNVANIPGGSALPAAAKFAPFVLGGLVGSIGLGSWYLGEAAKNVVWNNPKAFDTKDNPMLGAMDGDTAMGAAIKNQLDKDAREIKLTGEAKVSGEAKITIDIPGLNSRTVGVPLRGTVNANGPGSLGTSSPDAVAHPVGVGHN